MIEYIIYLIIFLLYILSNILLWVIYSNSGCFINICKTPYYLENTTTPTCFKTTAKTTLNVVLFSISIVIIMILFVSLIYLRINFDINRGAFAIQFMGLIILFLGFIIIYIVCVGRKFGCLLSTNIDNIDGKKYTNYNCTTSSGDRNNPLYAVILSFVVVFFLINIGGYLYGMNRLDNDD